MTFIDMPLEDAREQSTVPDGYYDLRILSFQETRNEDSGRIGTKVYIGIEDAPSDVNPAPIMFYIGQILSDDQPSTKELFLQKTKRFLTAFNIPHEGNGFSTEDLPGATATKIHVVEGEYEGRPKNELDLPPFE